MVSYPRQPNSQALLSNKDALGGSFSWDKSGGKSWTTTLQDHHGKDQDYLNRYMSDTKETAASLQLEAIKANSLVLEDSWVNVSPTTSQKVFQTMESPVRQSSPLLLTKKSLKHLKQRTLAIAPKIKDEFAQKLAM